VSYIPPPSTHTHVHTHAHTQRVTRPGVRSKILAPLTSRASVAAGVETGKTSQRSSQRVAIAEPEKVERPVVSASRTLSVLSRKSLSRTGSGEKPPAAAQSRPSLEAKLSTEVRAPSPIPEEPHEPESKAPAPPTRQSSLGRKISLKPPRKESQEATAKTAEERPVQSPPPSQPSQPSQPTQPKDEAASTTKQRGKSKATGQIVGGWI
jgi:hypothetical protein